MSAPKERVAAMARAGPGSSGAQPAERGCKACERMQSALDRVALLDPGRGAALDIGDVVAGGIQLAHY